MKKRQALMYFLIFFTAAIFIKWMFSSPNEEYVALKKNAETSTEQTWSRR